MIELLRSLKRNRGLLRDFIGRDLKARYVGSSMGFFWSVIFPIVNLIIYTFVFRVILRMRWDDTMPTEEVVLLMFAGILIWVSFAESVSRITNSLVENGNLIQKVVFPSEILAPYLTASAVVNMSLGLPVLFAGVLWFGYVKPARVDLAQADGVQVEQVAAWFAGQDPAGEPPAAQAQPPDELEDLRARVAELEGLLAEPAPRPAGSEAHTYIDREPSEHRIPPRAMGFGAGLLALPLLVLLQAIFTVGLGFLLSTLNLFLRDTYHLVGVFLTVWMFATPIFYPAALVRKEGFGWLLSINPMYWLIESYRSVLLYGAFPDWGGVGLFALIAALVFTLGAVFFRSQKDRFPDLL